MLRQLKTVLSLALVAALLCCVIGCAPSSSPERSSSVPARVVSLLPSATELLYAVGQGDKLVGVTLNDNFPAEVAKLPKVGDQTVDFEKLLSLKPDLVVIDANFNQDKAKLESLGFQVMELRCTRLEDVAPALRLLGERLGDSKAGEQAAADFERELQSVQALQVKGTAFLEVWGDPLMTAGSETLLSDVLSRVGVENCYKDQSGYFQVSPEDLASRSPRFVILPTPPGEHLESRALRLVSTVGGEVELLRVNSDLLVRPGPRLVQGIRELREQLEKFSLI